MVRMLASRCRILKRTLRMAVTSPAAAPAATASAVPSQAFTPPADRGRHHRRTQREAAVDGEVGKAEHPEGEVDPERHQPVDQPELDRTQEGDGAQARCLRAYCTTVFARATTASGIVDPHRLGRPRIDEQLGDLDPLDRDVAGLLALEHAHHDLAGLPARRRHS